jgi:hypothetical protein
VARHATIAAKRGVDVHDRDAEFGRIRLEMIVQLMREGG